MYRVAVSDLLDDLEASNYLEASNFLTRETYSYTTCNSPKGAVTTVTVPEHSKDWAVRRVRNQGNYFFSNQKCRALAETSTLVQWDSKKGDHRARESRFRELT